MYDLIGAYERLAAVYRWYIESAFPMRFEIMNSGTCASSQLRGDPISTTTCRDGPDVPFLGTGSEKRGKRTRVRI